MYHDDTWARILELMGARAKKRALLETEDDSGVDSDRTGLFTTGIVATSEGRQIAVFFTGRKHAGENLLDVLKHWDKLTLFLREPGAPLDNNICERALKKSIQHRKNALFYRTCNGARVGDLFMSLIYTCELCGANAFTYLTELQRHAEQVSANPAAWMPWNYQATIDTGQLAAAVS